MFACLLLSVTAVVLLLGDVAVGNSNVHTISSAEELIQFSDDVDSGKTYSGTTVFLDSDIAFTEELSNQFNPIGNFSTHFKGTFDGQGHIISNLKITSSSDYAGLFGYSSGITVRNLVFDEFCSVTSTYSSNGTAYVGMLIGHFKTSRKTVIESVVNMASVSFTGNARDIHLGGIVGVAWSTTKELVIKNCVNYGSVTSTGTLSEGNYSDLGGIVGQAVHGTKYIQNCLNYGAITYTGDVITTFAGGIIGAGSGGNITIYNCVNMGRLQAHYVGNVAGLFNNFEASEVAHCYWSSETGYDGYCQWSDLGVTLNDCYKFDASSFELTDTVSIGSFSGKSLIGALNAGVDNNNDDYSHWLLNKNENTVAFTINDRQESLKLTSKLILLPDLKDEEGQGFDGWYTDQSYTKMLESYNIDSTMSLYGRYNDNTTCSTISFETRGGSLVEPISRLPGVIVSILKRSAKDDSIFMWWEDSNGVKMPQEFTVPPYDVTLYAVWAPTKISSAEDLIEFSKSVNSGFDYSGITVSLEEDIKFTEELSGQFEPIGDDEHQFKGTFDGKGHIISNLKLSTSSGNYTSLFGYSAGASFSSIVVDGSCSFVSLPGVSHNDFVGSIAGRCENSVFENIVNMASLSSSRNATDDLWIGGIVGLAGDPTSGNDDSIMRNCVNYGTITFTGSSGRNTYIGGIAAEGYGRAVSNCANYGTIAGNGSTAASSLIGGIVGTWWTGTVENCLSVGRIVSTGSKQTSSIGSIAGRPASAGSVEITHCFWTGDVGCDYATERNSSGFKVTDVFMIDSLNTTTAEELNEYAKKSALSALSKWFILNLTGGSINGIGQEVLVVTQTHFPDPVKEGHTFRRWSTDAECNEEYHHDTSNTTVYACFEARAYNVSFDFCNGTVVSREMNYGGKYNPPELSQTGFVGWFTEKDGRGNRITGETTITTAGDHTIYAHFVVIVITKYTLTFIFDNGTEPEVRSLAFGSPIVCPEDPEKEGYRFSGWDKNESTMPSDDLNITALWVEKVPTFVEIVFESKELTKEGAESLIGKYTEDNFVIERFEADGGSGEIKVIVKFTDNDEAEKFLNRAKSEKVVLIKRIGYVDDPFGSLSSVIIPFLPFLSLF